MAQLKMYWRAVKQSYPHCPPGISYRTMRETQEDKLAWVELCKNGLLADDAGIDSFVSRMYNQEGFTHDSVFFVEQNQEPIATAAAIIRPNRVMGYLHMVSVAAQMRGKGIGSILNDVVKARFWEYGVPGAYLTTDEWRVPAIKSYLRAGFLPVEYDEGMQQRWIAWLSENSYRNIAMVDEQGNYLLTLLPD